MKDLEMLREIIGKKADRADTLADRIWSYAELAYMEYRSAADLIAALKEEGFDVTEGVAEMPTAFEARCSVGSGTPVIGFLAEYDALDGLSQKAGSVTYEPVKAGGAGHGCGHNLLGAGSWLATVAVRDYLRENRLDGTVVLFGCPAEEGAGAKQFMARAGCFDGVDFVYAWHPGTENEVQSNGDVAIMGANFIFDGVASHAGGSPHLGRSALDACEIMNIGVNYLREHMIDAARIHYAYSDAGGTAPNVVQSHAVIKYEVRAPRVDQMRELFRRVEDVAKGAALITGTQSRCEITMAFSDFVPNRVLSEKMDACLAECGAPEWTEEEKALAQRFLESFSESTRTAIREELAERFEDPKDLERALACPLDEGMTRYDPRNFRYISGSTDVGDVACATPTASLNIATACRGCVGHSWQWTAFSGSGIGRKGMRKAAEVMALAAVRTAADPDLIRKAREELIRKNGGIYKCPLPDSVKPPIGTY